MPEKLSWKDVFDGSKKNWESLVSLVKIAHNSGYKYLALNNGNIYELDAPNHLRPTGKTVDDVV